MHILDHIILYNYGADIFEENCRSGTAVAFDVRLQYAANGKNL